MNLMVLIARNARNALKSLIILSTTLAEPAESDELAEALLRSWIHSYRSEGQVSVFEEGIRKML